jgi:endonuclease-8
VRVEYRLPRLARKAKRLAGAGVTRVYARGKAMLVEFDRGLTHYSHNQLFGEWEVGPAGRGPDERRQVRVVLGTAEHAATLYSATDIDLLPTSSLARHPYLARLGLDVLDPATSVAAMRARLDDPRFAGRALASLLLDQGFAAGVGNYLRSDILFRAGLPATTRPRDLSPAQRARLARAMLDVSRRAYRSAGVTNDAARVRAARQAGMSREDYRFLVYGREGAPCWACGTTIERRDAGGRGLFHCPTCQPASISPRASATHR